MIADEAIYREVVADIEAGLPVLEGISVPTLESIRGLDRFVHAFVEQHPEAKAEMAPNLRVLGAWEAMMERDDWTELSEESQWIVLAMYGRCATLGVREISMSEDEILAEVFRLKISFAVGERVLAAEGLT